MTSLHNHPATAGPDSTSMYAPLASRPEPPSSIVFSKLQPLSKTQRQHQQGTSASTTAIFNFCLPRSKSVGVDDSKNHNEEPSTDVDDEFAWMNDLVKRSSSSSSSASNCRHHQGRDVQVALRETTSRCCQEALDILLSNDTAMNSYKRELLLDNMKILEERLERDQDDYEEDLLSEGDLEDDDDDDLEEGLEGSAQVVEYHKPLNDTAARSASTAHREETNHYRKELLLDSCYEDLNRALSLADADANLPEGDNDDDLLSQGDIEDDIEDDEEDEDDDTASVLSDSDYSQTRHVLGIYTE